MKKKLLAAILASALIVSAAACGNNNKSGNDTTTSATKAPEESTTTTTEAATAGDTTSASTENTAPAAGVMSFEDYKNAELDSEVTVETYVQAKQGWWENNGVGNATFYTQDDKHGAYFLYNMPCSKEEYDKLATGTKIRVTGHKSEWAGEVEITDAKFEILDGVYVASPEDVTGLLGTDALADHMNEFVSFTGMTVEEITYKDENTDVEEKGAFFYSWNNSGSDGDDLYFKASKDGKDYTFTVESYLCGKDTDVYKAVKELKIGDVIDMEGFLYWYNGANPHITSVKAAADASGVMSHNDFMAAELDTKVTVETYVQAKQGWWEKDGVGNATFYTQNEDGAYFLYNMPCSKDEYDKLVPGTKIKVTGYKAEWSGEVEITDAVFEILDGNYIAAATDVTSLLGKDEIAEHMNEFVSFKGMTVEAKDENNAAFFYSYDNSGEEGADLYFDVSLGGKKYTFTVESYLCGPDTDVYKAVKALKVGDKIDMEGFLYWYNGVNPHITSVKAAQ